MHRFVPSSSPATWLAIAAVLAALGFGAAFVSQANAGESRNAHCIQQITPMTADREAAGLDSLVGEMECFDSDAAALAATGAGAAISAGGARASLFTTYNILRLWENNYYSGADLLYYSFTGCSGYYSVGNLGSLGWNDRAQSAAVYCGRDVDLHKDTFLAGTYIRVYVVAPTFYGLDEEVSSWETPY